MTELVNTNNGDISTLDNLAIQARTFVQGACMNLLQLGRVLSEAKPLVPHGEWDSWIKENAKMSRRTAEQYMQAYAEFGLNTQIAELGTTKVLKLLPLQHEERDTLMNENNIAEMSTRQLDAAIKVQKEQAIKQARMEVKKELEQEKSARAQAEKRLKAAEMAQNTPDPAIESLKKENNSLKRDISEMNIMLEEQQDSYNRMQAELLNAKSAIAKGDAERIPADQLTCAAFASAVRSFIGTCARLPQMGPTLSAMDQAEKNEYEELLRTIEAWARDSRKAIGMVIVEGEASYERY